MNNRPTPTTTAVAALLASLALAGCGRPADTQTASTAGHRAVVQGEARPGDAAAQATAEASEAARRAAEATRQAARDAKEASQNAADQATNKVADALITTSVNAALAKDPRLSALAINVDTDAGRVSLHGNAPDQEAKDRATEIARGVEGVVSVENQLTVGGRQG